MRTCWAPDVPKTILDLSENWDLTNWGGYWKKSTLEAGKGLTSLKSPHVLASQWPVPRAIGDLGTLIL